MRYSISHSRPYYAHAFTLIEVLVVVAIFAVLGSAISIIGFSTYQQSLTIMDRDQLLSIIRLARADAQHDGGAASGGYGVHVSGGMVTVFAGQSFQTRTAASDDTYQMLGVETVSSDHDIFFDAVSGKSSAGGSITLTDNAGTHTEIRVAKDGSIDIPNHD